VAVDQEPLTLVSARASSKPRCRSRPTDLGRWQVSVTIPAMASALGSFSDLPKGPAVYALVGGQERSKHVAYVGVSGNLRQRIKQHLISRDSSVTTGTTAASLNPDHVTAVRWWEDPIFDQRDQLDAAEMVAFECLNPALRSRGSRSQAAQKVLKRKGFQAQMKALFSGEPTGEKNIPTLQMALQRVRELEARIEKLESRTRSE
ncbi:uncharacterized protein METZ01_LOCUS450797, partial [marine metagenome]